MLDKKLKLKNGAVLELQYDEKLLEVIRKHYNLSTDQEVLDRHLRDYIVESCKTAVQKAESNTFNHT